MEEGRIMKTRRLFVSASALLLVVGIAGGLAGGSRPAHAVVSIAYSGSNTVPYSGTVDGPPESVFLSGLVQIAFLVARDPDFGKPPSVLLDIDLSNVSGVGLKTGTRYVTSGGQRLLRPLVAADVVDVTFPFFPSGPGGSALARQALASFTITYNVTTGSVTSVTTSPSVNVVTQ
jgi:hypothetical protein